MAGPRGPRPTPTHLKLLRGNPGRRPLPNEPELELPDCLDAPPYLQGYGADEWHRIAKTLYDAGLLKNCDVSVRRILCRLSHVADGERGDADARRARSDDARAADP